MIVASAKLGQSLVLPEDEADSYDEETVDRVMSLKSSRVATKLSHRLEGFLETHPVGWTFGESATFQCFPDDPKKIRRADVAFFRRDRFPSEDFPDGNCRLAPDLAVEVISPTDTFYRVAQKIHEWRAAGVGLLWVIDPENRLALVYRAGQKGSIELTEDDDLDGGDLLPGFRCKLADVLPPRTLPGTSP